MFTLLLLCDFVAVLTVHEVTPNFSHGFKMSKPKPDPPKSKPKPDLHGQNRSHDPQSQSQSHDSTKPKPAFWL